MLDKLKTALVLIIIGAIAGAAIWGVNELTADTIIENRRIREEGYYKEIFELSEETEIVFSKTTLDEGIIVEEILIYIDSGSTPLEVDDEDEMVGVIYKGDTTNNYGDITVLVGLLTTDGTISKVVISNTGNTPTFVKGLEKELKGQPSYLDRFSGQSVDDYTIDEKTGATYSYGSVTEIIEGATSVFQESWGE